MEFFDVIEKRYSMRGFEDKEVEQEKLDKILKAAQLAPSGVNFQPFKVIVIDTKKNKEELSKIYPPEWFTEAPIALCVAASQEKVNRRLIQYTVAILLMRYDQQNSVPAGRLYAVLPFIRFLI